MGLIFNTGSDQAIIDRAHNIRRAVFIDEQKISEHEEWDGLDEGAIHFIAVNDGLDVGTGRLSCRDGIARLQRIAVLKENRGHNVGYDLVAAMLDYASRQTGLHSACLSGQCYAIPFYEKFGFIAEGDSYDDGGIAHRDMTRAL